MTNQSALVTSCMKVVAKNMINRPKEVLGKKRPLLGCHKALLGAEDHLQVDLARDQLKLYSLIDENPT